MFSILTAFLLTASVPAPHANATRSVRPPAVDGRLDEAVWGTAEPVTIFTQQYPHDGDPPSERTTMRILYDDEALYIGFDCEQIHSPILERLTRRDRDSESEWVSIIVDPHAEGKTAFAFGVNVSGVLLDAIITDPSNWNIDWDENWEAKAARTATGWSAELRVPFRILRFDAAVTVQSWGFQAVRYIAQRQEADNWSYFPRDVASPIAHFGRLENLSGLKRTGALELRPFVAGDVRRLDSTDTTTATGYSAQASAGLDLKLHIAQDLTLDGAIRPDFAQVEADQIILNLTNYETFLPEKRPLFLEGTEVFSFPLQVFYSRRIGFAPTTPTLRSDAVMSEKVVNVPAPATIEAAAKLVGRVGTNWTVGALSALTGRNDVTIETFDANRMPVGRSTRVVAPLTSYNVLRLKREWGSSGHVGMIATGNTAYENDGDLALTLCPSSAMRTQGTRCFRDSYVAGLDALWRSPSGTYVANGALIESLVHGGARTTQLDGTTIGPGAYAAGGWLRLAKEGGKHLLASASYSGAGRTLDYNDLGFMPRQNLHEVKTSVGYRTLDSGRFTIETSSAFEVTERRSLSGLDLGQLYELNSRMRFQNFWNAFLAADLAPARFDDREVGNGAALERGAYVGARLDVSTDPKRLAVLSLSGQAQAIQHDASAFTAQGALTLAPVPQFEISLITQATWSAGEWRYTSGTVPHTGSADDNVFGKLTATSLGATLRASYTFAPHLSLQTYAQGFLAAGHFANLRAVSTQAGQRIRIDDLAAAPLPSLAIATPDFEQAALNLNVVFRWEYRLGSTLFLVYSRSQVPDLGNIAAPATLQPRALGSRASADVILLKLSYWWAS